MKYIIYFTIVVISVGCISQVKQDAASTIAEMWGAKSASTGTATSANIQEGSINLITLTLENITSVKSDYPREKITSISALQFFRILTPEEFEGFDNILVTVKDSATEFEKNYKISDLQKAKDLSVVALTMGDLIIMANLVALDDLLDKKYISDSSIEALKNRIMNLDSTYGRPVKRIITGFEFHNISQTDEPIIVYCIELSNANASVQYNIMVAESNKKIVGIK